MNINKELIEFLEKEFSIDIKNNEEGKKILNKIEELQLNSNKKYGLIWENRVEDVQVQLQNNYPTIKEVKEREIKTDDNKPTNLLIEGDNYHSLSILQNTHKSKVNLIYIDPPYFTGNKDFIYNDNFMNREDSYRHSTWLSFINKRLKLAKELLTDDGVIFISIDDNEFAQLKLLCDDIFGKSNHLGNFIWKCRTGSNDSKSNLSINHEYILVYKKNSFTKFNGKIKDVSKYKNPDNDVNGEWISDNPSAASGTEKYRYEIVNPYTKEIYLPPIGRYWAFSIESYNKYIESGRIVFPRVKGRKFIYKRYLKDLRSMENPINSLEFVVNNVYLTSNGTKELKEIFPLGCGFKYPKSSYLIKDLISFYPNKNAIVLDFFAGSGTTGHAVLELNKEDGGNRQFILCTNNENNICEEVTYQRLNKVINGYTTPKGKEVEGLGGNLKYYKTDLLPKDSGSYEDTKYKFAKCCEDLLCIKENVFSEEQVTSNEYSIYSNNDKVVSIYLDTEYYIVYEDIINDLSKFNKDKVVYLNIDKNDLDTYEISMLIENGIEVKPIPEKLLQVYNSLI